MKIENINTLCAASSQSISTSTVAMTATTVAVAALVMRNGVNASVSQSKWREKFDRRRERVFYRSRVINSTSFIIREPEWR